jgi:hypothetical protein
MICHSCSASVEAGWAFCGGCGGALLAASAVATTTVMAEVPAPRLPAAATLPESPSAGLESMLGDSSPVPVVRSVLPSAPHELAEAARRPRLRRISTVAALVALVVAAVSLGWTAHSRGSHLASVRHLLSTTRAHLASTSSALASSKDEVQSQDDEIASLNAQIAKVDKQISNARTQLRGTRNTVDLQSTQIANLRTCLDGVSTALSDAADGFLEFALSDLQGVSGACQAANNGLA